MASKAEHDEKQLEEVNRELRRALRDCRKQLERAEKILASQQDNNFPEAYPTRP
jgi:hypothetical protein